MGCSSTKNEKPAAQDAPIPEQYDVDVYTKLLHDDITTGNVFHAVRVILRCSGHQKREICKYYKNLHNTDLIKEFEEKFTPLYATLCVYLMQEKTKSATHHIMRCLQEPGTRDLELIEVLGSRTPQELNVVRETYKTMYGVDLEVAIKENISEEISGTLLDLIKEKEPSSTSNDEWAKMLVDSMDYNNLFEGKRLFAEAFKSCPSSQLTDVLELFLKKCQRDINVEIEKFYQDNEYARTRLTAICSIVRTRPLFLSEKIHALLDKFKKNSEPQQTYLIFLILTLHEDYLAEVKDRYQSAFFEMLPSDIRAEITDEVIRTALLETVK